MRQTAGVLSRMRQDAPTSPTLLQRLKNPADREAWDLLVWLYTPLLRHWARTVGVSGQDADDLVQEVFVLLLKKLRRFEYDENSSFRGWLRTVTINKWNELRRKLPQSAAGDSPETQFAAVPPEVDVFEIAEHNRYLAHRAWELIQTDFEQSTLQAFWQTVWMNRPTAEVAKELGVSAAVIYAAKSRVMRRLREVIQGLCDV